MCVCANPVSKGLHILPYMHADALPSCFICSRGAASISGLRCLTICCDMKKGRLLHAPAMRDCDIVYRHRCTLCIVYYIGAARLLVFHWICIGHGAGLSREPLFRSLGCTDELQPCSVVVVRYLHQVQALLGFSEVRQVQAGLF